MSFVSFMLKMMAKSGQKVVDRLELATRNPAEEQKKLLFSLLEKNKDTELGKKLGFADIKTIEDFQKKIPLTDFDFYAPDVEKAAAGQKNVMTSDPVVHLNLTSGTLGNPKRIPVTEEHIQAFAAFYSKYLFTIASKKVGFNWTKGKGLTLTEGSYQVLESGISCGSASSISSARMQKMFAFGNFDVMSMMYTSPIEARMPVSGMPTRFIHALFALREKNVTYASCTFSSYLYEFMCFIENNWQSLTDALETGVIPAKFVPVDAVRASLEKKLKPDKKRADELRAIFQEHDGKPLAMKLWPDFSFILTVGGAGFSIYTDKIKERFFGSDVTFVFLGLSASEGLFSVPFETENASSVFIPYTSFLEFLPVDENGEVDYNGPCLTMDKLEKGKDYELVLTNLCGLVRYKMKDVITVTGFYNKTPVMEFKSRTGFAINMYGEKTSEAALREMIQKTGEELKLDIYDYAVCPDDDETPGKYVLCLELKNTKVDDLDLQLISDTATKYLIENNPVYGMISQSGHFKPMSVKILEEETFLLYRDLMIMKGRAAAQLKPVHVLDNPFLKKFFYKLSY